MKIIIQPILSFRDLANGASFIEVNDVKNFTELSKYLSNQFPKLHEKIYMVDGTIRNSVLLFINDQQIHREDIPKTFFQDAMRIMLVPSIVGG